MTKRKPAGSTASVPALVPEQIDCSILLIRGHKVLLDSQPGSFYGVETRVLNQAVRRNQERFPEDFMFQLSDEEFEDWKSQIVISNPAAKMGLRKKPYAFTEQGVAMLSSVLRSPRAVEVNIQIMRAFVRLRQLLSVHKELADRLAKLEAQGCASAIMAWLSSSRRYLPCWISFSIRQFFPFRRESPSDFT